MSIPRFWQYFESARRVEKTRGLVKIPAFNYQVSEKRSCLFFNKPNDTTYNVDFQLDLTHNLVYIQFWMKPTTAAGDGQDLLHMYKQSAPSTTDCPLQLLYWKSGFQYVFLSTLGTQYVGQAFNVLTPGVWQHVTLAFGNASLLIYVDGVLVHTSVAFDGTFKYFDQTLNCRFGQYYGLSNYGYQGYLDDIRIVTGLQEFGHPELVTQYYKNPIHNYTTLAATLIGPDSVFITHYYRFSEGSGSTATDSINSHVATLNSNLWSTEGYSPNQGAPFVAARIDLALTQKLSLLYPVAESGLTTFILVVNDPVSGKRYSLWEVDGFDLPLYIILYNGEVLSTSAFLEVWVEPTADYATMSNDLYLQTSVLHENTDETSTAQIIDVSAIPTNAIFGASTSGSVILPAAFNAGYNQDPTNVNV